MHITLAAVILDTAELDVESTFWQGLLGGEVERRERHHLLRVAGQPLIAFQLAENHVGPEWPAGEPQQLHLDFAVDDIEAGQQRVLELGGRLLHDAAPRTFRVFADPSGHPFCLTW